jgi:hypothetical protein
MALFAAGTALKTGWLLFTSYLIGRHLSGKSKSKALETGKPATLAERGQQLPVLIGRGKLGPLFHWGSVPFTRNEGSAAGGKGIGVGGANVPGYNQVYFADGAHFIAVGPGWRLRSIRENGEIIWPLPGATPGTLQLPNGITRTSHPSGSTLGTTVPQGGTANHGNFTVWWGDTPAVGTTHWTHLAQATGVQSNWPFVFGVFWHEKRLGGAGVWGVLEYDVEVQPYSTLSGSDAWLNNGEALTTDPADIKTVINYVDPNVTGGEPRSQLWVAGDQTTLFPTGGRFRLRNSLVGLDGDYYSNDSVWAPGEIVTIPDTAYDTLIIPWDASTWTTVACTIAVATSPSIPPGYFVVTGSDSNIWRTTNIGGGVSYRFGSTILGNPDNADPSNSLFGDAIGTDVSSLTLYINLANAPNESIANGHGIYFGFCAGSIASPATGDFARIWIRRQGSTFVAVIDSVASNQYATSTPPALTIALWGQLAQGTSTWWRLTVNFKCPLAGIGNFTVDTKYRWCLTVVGPFGGGTTAPGMDFLVVDEVFHQASANNSFKPWARRVISTTPITGVTKIYVGANMTGGIPFQGTIAPYIPDPDGTAGANVAHSLWQLMFETDPHGLGTPQGPWDIDSLEQLGIDYGEAGEGLRSHALVEQRIPIKQVIADLCNDFGIEIAWDIIIGKYGFKKRRAETPFAVVPREMLAEELVSRTRKLESDPARSFIFAFQSANDLFAQDTVEVDDFGNIHGDTRAGAELLTMNTVKDRDTALRLAGYRSSYEVSRGVVVNLKLKNDAATLRAGDVIDVEAITDIDIPFRLISTNRQPLSSVAHISGFFDHMNVEDVFVLGMQGARQFPPGVPEQPEADYAVATLQQADGTYLFLRIPSHPEALVGALLVSDDSISYWGIGTIPACAGGPILEDFDSTMDEEEGFMFYEPTDKISRTLPQLPAGAVVEGVLRLLTEEREVIYFRELESFGAGVWRVKGMLRAQDGTTAVGMVRDQKIWIWHNDEMPSFVNNLPTTGTPAFKIVPYTTRRVADVPSITDDPIVP